MYPNILVTGTPGVGKTFIAMRLAKLFGLRYVSINDLVIDAALYLDYDDERDTYIVDLDRASKYIRESLGWDGLVLEGHVAHLIVPEEYVDLCIVVRLNPYILYPRLMNRGYGVEKALENVQTEILDVIYQEVLSRYGSNIVLNIDVSHGYGKLYRAVGWVFGKCDKPSSDRVDWLSLISANNDLSLFFPSSLPEGIF